MAIPTSSPWNLVSFDETNLSSMLGLGPSDLSLSPGGSPYFTYDAEQDLVRVLSNDGIAATADLNVGMPNRYTLELIVRFPRLPNDHGDVADHRVGITIADDSSRGVSIYFARTGIAVSRIDDFGSVAPIPNTADSIREVDRTFHRIRVAVDGSGGLAYVLIGEASNAFPPVEAIIPVEQTPAGVIDTFQLFATGTVQQSVQVEYKAVRLGTGIIIPNLPPVADAGPDRVIPVGQVARLNGRGSFDVEGAQLTYSWSVIDAPYGSAYVHEGSNGSSTDDGDADGFTDLLSFPALSLPSWVAAGDILVVSAIRAVVASVSNVTGTLTVTEDVLPDALSAVPFRILRQSLIVGADTETPYIVPDVQGVYRLELIVNDGESDSDEAEVLVNVVGARAPFGIEPDVDIIWNGLGDEWQYVENRHVFTEFWRGTAQVLGSKLLEAWQYHYNFSIRDAQRTFQKKWLAYRTLITETDPDNVIVSPRYGSMLATHDFSAGNPAVTGETLVIEYATEESVEDLTSVVVTFTGDTLAQIVTDLTTALAGTDIEAADVANVLRLRSLTRAFRISSSSTAAALLGLSTDTFNYLLGIGGARVTEKTYRVEAGIHLQEHGVQRGDLLVLNNGQAFRIDRVLDDTSDPTRFQRILLFDSLPADASAEWEIPSVVRSEEVDYEFEGSYPGDLVKAEVFDTELSEQTSIRGTVVAQRGVQVGARLDGFFGAVRDTERYDIRLLGIKRRKAIRIDAEILSIPQLQDLIPQSQSPTTWQENVDFYLEPFYRDVNEAAVPMLQFRDEVFITPDTEPPDIFWAELTLFSNEGNVENLFGRLVGFLRDDAATFSSDFNYVSAVAGLLYTQVQSPTPAAIKTGAQILLGQPFAETKGIITEIRSDFSPTLGRLLIQDYDGFDPPRTDVIRSYIYRKDPLDASATSGLEINLATGVPYAEGDTVEQFAPLGSGVDIIDMINDPDWFVPFVRSGLFTELEKFFQFLVRFNLDLVDVVNLSLVFQFLTKVKPTYTFPILLGFKSLEEDIDIVDSVVIDLTLHEVDSMCPSGRAFIYDDYRGDGTVWSTYDDGLTYYDGIVDCVYDYIEFLLEMDWGGGVLTYGALLFYDLELTDVDGVVVSPGGTFLPTYDQNIPAGTFQATLVIDSGKDVLP